MLYPPFFIIGLQMTNTNKLFRQANITDQDRLMLQTHAFIATKTKTPVSNLEIGSICYSGQYYYLVCDILSDQALVKELAQKNGEWYVSDRTRVKYLIELGEEVELPAEYDGATASFFRDTHIPKNVDKPLSEHAWNKWWS
jgi:hypothetical protein